jgi:predicted nuclease with TOPRIM domain
MRTTPRQYLYGTQEISVEDRIPGNLCSEIAHRLEFNATEVAEFLIRLKMIERAETTLDEKRQRLLKNLQQVHQRTQQTLEKVEAYRRISDHLQQQRMTTEKEVERFRQCLSRSIRRLGRSE